MPALWRRWSAAVVLTAVGAGLLYLGADMLSRLGLDFGELAALRRQMDESARMREELERQREVYLRRIAGKDQAVGELLAGRKTLPQAAARFRNVEDGLPVTGGPACGAASSPADGERWCREVIAWAINRHEEDLPDLGARLEVDLRRHWGTDGAVRLPD